MPLKKKKFSNYKQKLLKIQCQFLASLALVTTSIEQLQLFSFWKPLQIVLFHFCRYRSVYSLRDRGQLWNKWLWGIYCFIWSKNNSNSKIPSLIPVCHWKGSRYSFVQLFMQPWKHKLKNQLVFTRSFHKIATNRKTQNHLQINIWKYQSWVFMNFIPKGEGEKVWSPHAVECSTLVMLKPV